MHARSAMQTASSMAAAAAAAEEEEEEAQLFLGGRGDVGFPTLFNLPTPPTTATATILGRGNEK